jgi:RHS repeat-associated protein
VIGGREWGSIESAYNALNFHHTDWLGTTRLFTDINGNTTGYCTNLPFGDTYTCTGNAADPNYFQYTGLPIDSNSGLMMPTFRNYGAENGYGVWYKPDPAGLAAVDPSNPQSWNRYAYVNNNPVSMVDPLGLDGDDSGGGGDSGMPGSPAGIWSPTTAGLPCFMCGGVGGPLPGSYGGASPPTFSLGGLLASQEAQAEIGYINQMNAPPSGPGWGPFEDGDPEEQALGGMANSITDETWFPAVIDNSADLLASAADVQRIQNVFNSAINRMNQKGQRRPGKGLINGLLNDLEYWGTGYQACTGQSYIMCDSLNAAGRTLDDNWTFTVQSNFWHTWVSGTSPNPADPSITIDPLYGTFTVNYPTTP